MLPFGRVMPFVEGARTPLAVLLFTCVACGGDDGGGATPGGEPSAPSGVCNAVTQEFEVKSALHLAECSALPEAGTPPAGGDHYGSWAAFQGYDFAVPHGYLLHSMEHGAVVLYYDCPDGCSEEVEQVQAWLDSLPEDPLCVGTGALRRAVLTPDPSLDVRWAASAWGHNLRADCFDPVEFGAFYQEHYARAPENFCSAGLSFTESPCP